jgi:hypothetical protein
MPPAVRVLVIAIVLVSVAVSNASAATVTIVHGVPGFTADVYVNGVKRLDGFAAGAMTSPIHIPAGRYRIAIRPAGAPPNSKPALAGTVTLGKKTNASLVAYLRPGGKPALAVFPNPLRALPAGRSRLVFRQVADAPPAGLVVDGRVRVRGVKSGQSRATLQRSGAHRLAVRLANGRTIWGPAGVRLRPGSVYLVYSIGSLKKGTLDQLVQRIADRTPPPRTVQAGTSGLLSVAAQIFFRAFGHQLQRALVPAPALASAWPTHVARVLQQPLVPIAAPALASAWPTHVARVLQQPLVPIAAPVRVLIPSLRVAAPVTQVGFAPGGGLALPPANAVGWYRYGAAPGASGSTVLAAHVDYAGAHGAFWGLRQLHRGALVVVERADGQTMRFRVVSLRRYAKAALPSAEIFSTTGRARLTLVTCGGLFDQTTGHYADNIVATAVETRAR